MHGTFAGRAKVVSRRDEARAEMLLPDAVHNDARRERMTGMHECARQLKAAVVRKRPVVEGREELRQPARHPAKQLQVLSPPSMMWSTRTSRK
jgi:hypothetical protein